MAANRLVRVPEQRRQFLRRVGGRGTDPTERGGRLTANRGEVVSQRPTEGRDGNRGRLVIVARGSLPAEEPPAAPNPPGHAHQSRPLGLRLVPGDQPECFDRTDSDQVTRIHNQSGDLGDRIPGAEVAERTSGDRADVLVRVAQVSNEGRNRGRPDRGEYDGQLVPLFLGERRHLPQRHQNRADGGGPELR